MEDYATENRIHFKLHLIRRNKPCDVSDRMQPAGVYTGGCQRELAGLGHATVLGLAGTGYQGPGAPALGGWGARKEEPCCFHRGTSLPCAHSLTLVYLKMPFRAILRMRVDLSQDNVFEDKGEL